MYDPTLTRTQYRTILSTFDVHHHIISGPYYFDLLSTTTISTMMLNIAFSIKMMTLVAQFQFVSSIIFMSLPRSNYADPSPARPIAVSPAQRTSLSRSQPCVADSSNPIAAARPARSVDRLVLPRVASAAAGPSASDRLSLSRHFVTYAPEHSSGTH